MIGITRISVLTLSITLSKCEVPITTKALIRLSRNGVISLETNLSQVRSQGRLSAKPSLSRFLGQVKHSLIGHHTISLCALIPTSVRGSLAVFLGLLLVK